MVIIKTKMCTVICVLTGALRSRTGAELRGGKETKVGGLLSGDNQPAPQPPEIWPPWISRSAHSAPSNNSSYCLCHIPLRKEFEGQPD